MADPAVNTASAFLAAVFGAYSEANVFVCALPNVRGDHGERALITRDFVLADRFVRKWDRPGTAIYYCVGTIRPGAQPLRPGGSVRSRENVAEILTLASDTDLKSVEIGREDIIAKYHALEFPPSVIVWSGRGAQGLWLLNEALPATPETIARVEALNAQLADVVAGDPIQDVSRLLRLPGSHNTKEGGWRDVAVIRAQYEPRYALEDLEEWLSRQSPVMKKKPAEPAPGRPAVPGLADNPYLAVAALFGIKPPMDVEERLSAMAYQGAGETSIHQTQLEVSAALLTRGRTIDEAVAILMAATRAAAGEYGARWNWEREERLLRRMCDDWIRKHPEVLERQREAAEAAEADEEAVDGEGAEATAEAGRDGAGPADAAAAARHAERGRAEAAAGKGRQAGATVHSLAAERQRRSKDGQGRAKEPKPSTHQALGAGVLAALQERGEAILFTKKTAWRYRDGIWAMETDGLSSWLNVQIEMACAALNIVSTLKLISEARGWIQRRPELWRDEIPFDRHGKVPCRSGLVDPRTGEIEPIRPEHYCTWVVDTEFDPAARCPLWLQMLDDVFPDRTATVRKEIVATLQEVLGCAMVDVKSRQLTKALVLVGGSNVGKSGLLEVLGGMFGDDPISVALDSLEGTHGKMPFVRRAPWVLHEAFDQRKWHFASGVKAIITGDPVEINVKNGPIISGRVRAPIFWGTNYPPQFKESTRAIVNRMIVIHCRNVFDDHRLVGVAQLASERGYDKPSSIVLAKERAGVLNWALEGLRRALDRGSIAVPAEVRENADAIHKDANIVAGFIDECIEWDHEMRVPVPDFCAAFSVWWAENKGEDRSIPSNDSIGRAVTALGNERIGLHARETRDMHRRYLCGIALNPAGIAFWKRAHEARAFEGKTASTTPVDENPNTAIPATWRTRDTVIRMIEAHRRTAHDASAKGSVMGRPEVSCAREVSCGGSVMSEASGKASWGQASSVQAVDESRDPQF
ncbi:DNA primase family protein [Methylobacterium nodulans]|uniref:Phage/plasmid primase, P4 family n=1 Tax=Methylobacterium nodulans (strain LMG 21967 / CNCM I-2342 / ORS 2060) TaxID=460265 RepID=B8IRR1_METNO|nr:DNA primase family protein [Methylobacterium nodulans]ACL60611.1 phage/plasmid primase, P4 family [Methylobacterium nodulans ORS 2060]